jgi:hypothetical protein
LVRKMCCPSPSSIELVSRLNLPLTCLFANSPVYANITLSRENLDSLPECDVRFTAKSKQCFLIS